MRGRNTHSILLVYTSRVTACLLFLLSTSPYFVHYTQRDFGYRGARFAWPILNSDPTYYAGAMISAGIPFEDPSELYNMTSVPLRIYAGAKDYEEASQVYQMTECVFYYFCPVHSTPAQISVYTFRYYNALVGMGAQNAELIVLPEGTHNSMQQDPFDMDLYYWFLNQTKGPNPYQSENPSISASYDVIESINSVSTQANAFSIYQDGFPSGSAPAETPADIAATMASASAAWASITSVADQVNAQPSMVASAVIQAAKSSAMPVRWLSPSYIALLAATAGFFLL